MNIKKFLHKIKDISNIVLSYHIIIISNCFSNMKCSYKVALLRLKNKLINVILPQLPQPLFCVCVLWLMGKSVNKTL